MVIDIQFSENRTTSRSSIIYPGISDFHISDYMMWTKFPDYHYIVYTAHTSMMSVQLNSTKN